MEWINYLIIGVIITAVIALLYFKPSTRSVVLDATASFVKKNEAWVVMAVYNRLPSAIKSKVSSKEIAGIVSFAIDEVVESLEKLIKK